MKSFLPCPLHRQYKAIRKPTSDCVRCHAIWRYVNTHVAGLFIDPEGPYPTLDDPCYVDCWDKKRNAMMYHGPYPVVAHPPCQLWGSFAHVNFKRYGGEHNRPGNDGGMFEFALRCVRHYGGILEHPAYTKAWKEYYLEAPDEGGWKYCVANSGRHEWEYWVCHVYQVMYGCKAQKGTWLLYCGNQPPFDLNWEKKPGTHQIGHDRKMKNPKPTLGKKEASRTPVLFAKELVKLALHSKETE